MTESLTSKLDDKNKPTFDNLAKTGSELIVRTFDAIESVYPINDDRAPDRDRPLPPRGYEKRSSIPALDPRRLVEIGEKQLEITAGQLTRIVTGDNGSVTP